MRFQHFSKSEKEFLRERNTYISRHRGCLNSDVRFKEDAGSSVERRLDRARLRLLVQRAHAAGALLGVGLLRDRAQRGLGVVSAWLLTDLLAALASYFLFLVTAARFWLVGFQLEPRGGRLRGGGGEAVPVAERLDLAWWTNHHQQHG